MMPAFRSDPDTIRDRFPRPDPRSGVVLADRFRILRPLAEGAMGCVYEGVQLPFKRPVAIKLIRDELSHDEAAQRRFLREARVLSKLAHPNIVEIFDYGATPEGQLFLVMERLRGTPLDEVLREEGPFSVKRTCEVGLQLCDALIGAHAAGIVHRDLKPANIMLLPGLGDWLKVLDFGLAKSVAPAALDDHDEPPASSSMEITMAGVMMGTPMYMAPEAIQCDVTDPRTDLYALGCILYELLTGAPPFSGETNTNVLARQLVDVPAPLPSDVSAPLQQLVTDLLAKEAAHRPASAHVVRARLEEVLAAHIARTPALATTRVGTPPPPVMPMARGSRPLWMQAVPVAPSPRPEAAARGASVVPWIAVTSMLAGMICMAIAFAP